MRNRAKRTGALAVACGAVGAMVALPTGGAAAAPATTALIAYQSLAPVGGAPGNVSHIFVMNTDGQGVPVTNGAQNDVDPAWSPDGTKIAFAREDAANDFNIYVMNADGSGLAKLTSRPRDDRYPAWSANGRIAFRGYPSPTSGGTQIFTMNPDGSGQTAVPSTAGGDQPTWSPDAGRIAFTLTYAVAAGAPTTDDDIAVVNADGTGLANLTHNTTTSDRYASWSPTNPDLLLFRRLDTSGAGRELYSLTVSTGAVTNMTSKLGPGRAASWSPDGASMVFVSHRAAPGNQEIWLSSFDATSIPPRQLTHSAVNSDEPRWANVPVALAPVPPGTAGAGTAVGGGGVQVGGGTVNGRQLLALTLIVPKREKLGKRKTLTVFAHCNQRCIVTITGSWKTKNGRKTKVYRLFRSRHTVLTHRTTFRLRIPTSTLKAVRGALVRRRGVTFRITGSARTTTGEFTPAANRKLVLRR